MKHFVIYIIYAYRWLISPILPPSCKFHPTCSRYAIQAIEHHGLLKGLFMTVKRLLRCQPVESLGNKLGKTSGYDPVPPHVDSKESPKKAA